jgi:phosphatidylinositol alpha-1,6-mannosyltransferase
VSILLLTEVFPPKTGGSGNWFWEIYRRLPRGDVLVAAGDDARAQAFDKTHDLRLRRLPLTLADWGFCSLRGSRTYCRLSRTVSRLARTEDITQIHCGRCIPEGWIAWLVKKFTGRPYLCYAHGEDVNLDTSGSPQDGVLASRQLRWMTRKVLKGAQMVIANSQNTSRILLDGWKLAESRVRLLYPGVDTAWFLPAARSEAVRQALRWNARPVILTVGRLQKRKGHDCLIRALPAIRQAHPDVLYAIVGEGEERPALEQLTADLRLQGHVQFLGELPQGRLLACYQQCNLFVLPNRQVGKDIEGFGMVLLEAQSCGKPVVAGASGGTAETLLQGETGYTVCCDGHEDLAGLITELLADPERRQRLGQRGREWAVENFDWGPLSRQAKRIFQGLKAPEVAGVL